MSSKRRRAYAVGPGRRTINRVYTALTRLGLGATYRHLLTVTGRRTGLARTTPVDVMSLHGTCYLVAPYGEVSWVHNVRACGTIELSRRGHTCRYLAREVGPGEAVPVIRRYIARVPVTRAWWSVRAGATDADLGIEAATHPVFRLDPELYESSPGTSPVRE
jgi:deazaflavin-dependent oxidoreductase (nitroreductase family)